MNLKLLVRLRNGGVEQYKTNTNTRLESLENSASLFDLVDQQIALIRHWRNDSLFALGGYHCTATLHSTQTLQTERGLVCICIDSLGATWPRLCPHGRQINTCFH